MLKGQEDWGSDLVQIQSVGRDGVLGQSQNVSLLLILSPQLNW